ncbi:MAG: hypothetical protein QOG37_1080 [Mycobacterium sp.]|nr:hypothetical protein [Mycobacterium sp.]
MEHRRRPAHSDRAQHGLAPVHRAVDRGVSRGRDRDGGSLAGATVVAENPKRWTSRYGSLITTVYGIGTVDGLNERGLGVHALYLKSTDVGPRDPAKPGLHTEYGEFGIYNTEYRTVTDLTHQMYFFTSSPNVTWVELDGLEFTKVPHRRQSTPYDESLIGNVRSRFTPRQMAF